MKGILVAVVLVVGASTVSANPTPFADASGHVRGTTARTVVDSRAGAARPSVTKLHPVVGSVHRTGHFTNPITHRTKYSDTVYNPVLGQFGLRTFRR